MPSSSYPCWPPSERNHCGKPCCRQAALRSPRLLVPDVQFQLGTYCDVIAEQDFRFAVRLLARLFALPAVIVTESNDRCHDEEATALLLFRLSFPRRLHDMASTFGRSRHAISRIFLWMNARYSDRMNFHLGVMGQRLEYAARLPVKDTDLKICSAKCTSGHKRMHTAFSFKVILLLIALFYYFYRILIIIGARIDYTGHISSDRLKDADTIRQCLLQANSCSFFCEHAGVFGGKAIFGDPAYSVRDFVVTHFKDAVLSAHARNFNREMSAVRTAVEWNFGIMKRL
ncbi:hypothetical protein JG687_00012396 [Phytophthora cactorum]|uniref:DDE Tnp4 domain-containing protein n=1 Tax=Phytophthora cactorum TaxID=29920 RepID=A0A8T1U402_9STRA|nr:hypothetical protein JG687_00012396 [Phytophthora cactorum]